jgi:hypothetical protein
VIPYRKLAQDFRDRSEEGPGEVSAGRCDATKVSDWTRKLQIIIGEPVPLHRGMHSPTARAESFTIRLHALFRRLFVGSLRPDLLL